MKKIVFAAAIALVAICAQANTMLWGVNSAGTLDATKFKSGTCYLLLTDSSTGLPDYSGLAKKSSYSAADIAASSTVMATGAISSGAFAGSDVITTLSGKNYFYMAIISSDGKNMAISTTTKTATMGDNVNNTTMKWMATQYTTYSATGGGGVPEPTSGLLLVLGGAMLALRRRRA